MYVCLCNALTDRDLRRVADKGHCDIDSAYRALDAEINCGHCMETARGIIERQALNTPTATVAAE